MGKNRTITLLLVCAFGVFAIVGCNDPALPALDQVMKTNSTIVEDFSNMTIQQSLDAAGKAVEAAVTAGDVKAAQKALVDHNQLVEQVLYLVKTHERSRAVYMMARTYISSKRLYLQVLVDDLRKAKEKSDANDATQ